MEERIYYEEIRSSGTSALFAVMAVIFLALFAYRLTTIGWNFGSGLFLFLGVFFLFYFINYRTLKIVITNQTLKLEFGLVGWTIALDNIRSCQEDDPPLWIKYGGAGVHFAMVGGEYRAFFNFLEYPRVKVTFQTKRGWVEALSFSTRQPDRILELLGERSGNHGD